DHAEDESLLAARSRAYGGTAQFHAENVASLWGAAAGKYELACGSVFQCLSCGEPPVGRVAVSGFKYPGRFQLLTRAWPARGWLRYSRVRLAMVRNSHTEPLAA